MTIYDFFIKRALDQYFYNQYWKSSFICVGTPSGVTLSPEGAQHGWKSDLQIPNQITWEPFFCQELDWIFCESIRRHMFNENTGRSGVLIRGVTRGIEQKDLLTFLKKQMRFKNLEAGQKLARAEYPIDGGQNEESFPSLDEAQMLEAIRLEVLQGAYYLIDYRGYAGYEPGDNVVNILSMGSPTTEAIKASEALLSRGIYANVIVVTSSDLLCGGLAHENNYEYLRRGLGLNADLFIRRTEEVDTSDLTTVAGRRVPLVSVHDGEPGLLDNLGSIVGVRQESCAVRKHSKCGRPEEIYHFHGIDDEAIIQACGKVLSETALEQTIVSQQVLSHVTVNSTETTSTNASSGDWTQLWPVGTSQHKH
jgi:pyruvate dehydrogenase E1 component